MRAGYMQSVLHGRVRPLPPSRVGVPRGPRLAPVSMRAPEALRPRVDALVTGEVIAALGRRGRSVLSQILLQNRPSAEVVEQLEVLLAEDAGLSTSVRQALLAEFARSAEPSHRRALVELATSVAFTALPLGEQLQLIGWFAGPAAKVEDPDRASQLDAAWARRRAELSAFSRSGTPVAAFLQTPAQEVRLAQSTAYRWHALVSFGDPDDPAEVSYGQRWSSEGDRWDAWVQSPDAPDHSDQFDYVERSILLTRIEELALVDWLEARFADDLTDAWNPNPLGPRPMRSSEHFYDDVLHTITAIVAGRGATLSPAEANPAQQP